MFYPVCTIIVCISHLTHIISLTHISHISHNISHVTLSPSNLITYLWYLRLFCHFFEVFPKIEATIVNRILKVSWACLSIELEICADIDDFIFKNIHLLEFLLLNRNCVFVEFTQGTLYVVPHHQNLHKRKSNWKIPPFQWIESENCNCWLGILLKMGESDVG